MNEFEQMHTSMVAYVVRHEAEGWSGPEEERAAVRLKNYLFECANNELVHHTAFTGVAVETAKLQAAMKGAA